MEHITQSISSIIQQLFGISQTAEVTLPDPQFGDLSTNIALQLSKKLQRSPKDIAGELVQHLSNIEGVDKVEIAGPGFINLWLQNEILWNQAQSRDIHMYEGMSFVIEYSCPNYFKELHAGHLYQTLYGNAVSRIVERAGAKVHRTNFGADVGLSAARAMWGIIRYLGGELPNKLQDIPEAERTKFIAASYVDGAKADTNKDDTDATATIAAINKRIYAMHSEADTSSPFAQIYFTTREWCRQYFIRLYEELDVDPFEKFYPESSTEKRGVQEVMARVGSVFVESNGAVVYDGESEGLHTRVFITKENLPTYETKDLGLILIENEDFAFDRRVLITGREQTEYMKVVWQATDKVLSGVASKMTHLTNGLIRFGDGQKMSSRLGNVTTALDVIAAVKQAVPQSGDSEKDRHIYLGALKYELLRYRLGGDIAFDPVSSVSMQGNSGPYLQYALVRAKSILSKLQVQSAPISSFEADERRLVQKLAAYSHVLAAAATHFETHNLCSYLYELAGEFNVFYENNLVVGSDREVERAQLVAAYATTLSDGLSLLGITAPERM